MELDRLVAYAAAGARGPCLARHTEEKSMETQSKHITYADAGVDVDEGARAVDAIKAAEIGRAHV